jgi:LysM repeat protein
MRVFREAFVGLVSAFSTSLLVLGAITLAMTEGMVLPAPGEASETPQVEEIVTFNPTFTTPTPRPTKKPLLVAATTQPVKPTCAMSAGWEKYTVRTGDTWESLPAKFGVTVKQILDANCWSETFPLLADTTLLMLLPTATPTPTASQTVSPKPPTPTVTRTFTRTFTRTVRSCYPKQNWNTYIVQPGDRMIRIAELFNINLTELLNANCMNINDTIYPGDTIFVPPGGPYYTPTNRPPATSTRPPATSIPTSTFTATFTWTPVPPTRTFTPTPSATFTLTPSATFTSTATATPVPPSLTPTPTRTFTPTGTKTSTSTSTPTATYTPTLSGQ